MVKKRDSDHSTDGGGGGTRYSQKVSSCQNEERETRKGGGLLQKATILWGREPSTKKIKMVCDELNASRKDRRQASSYPWPKDKTGGDHHEIESGRDSAILNIPNVTPCRREVRGGGGRAGRGRAR